MQKVLCRIHQLRGIFQIVKTTCQAVPVTAIVFWDYFTIKLGTRTQTTDGIDMGYQPMVHGLREHSEAQGRTAVPSVASRPCMQSLAHALQCYATRGSSSLGFQADIRRPLRHKRVSFHFLLRSLVLSCEGCDSIRYTEKVKMYHPSQE